jgi:hypothetical protein
MSMPDRPERRSPFAAPLFPVVLAVAWVLDTFEFNGDPLPHLWRPLIITTLAVVAIVGIVWVVSRRRPLPSLIAGILVLLFLKAWPLLGAVLAITAWRGAVWVIRRSKGEAPLPVPGAVQVTRLANAFALVVLAVVLVSLIPRGVIGFMPATATRGPLPATAPNIYFVLLDGYPREDSLQALGIDNRAFIGELEERGFATATASHTNYHRTQLTLISMFNGQYVAALPELANHPNDRAAELRLLNRALGGTRLLDDLRRHGYTIIESPSAYGATTVFTADVLMSPGGFNHFDHLIVARTFLGDLLSILSPGLVDGWLRGAVLAPMEDAASIAAGDYWGPHFMLAHVLSPHVPFLFDATGADPHVQACYAAGCAIWTAERKVLGLSAADYARLLEGQIRFLNGKVLEMVDHLTADDPNAVIVLFGDHGMRFDTGVSTEYFRNFFAARTPGHPGLLPDDISPVNVLSMVENAYLGTDLPVRDYEAWESEDNFVLRLVRWLPDPQ